jgi:hypothetical protein
MKVGLIILVLLVMLLGPLAAIWALNTLFALSIAYTLKSWLAMMVVSFVFGKSTISLKWK